MYVLVALWVLLYVVACLPVLTVSSAATCALHAQQVLLLYAANKASMLQTKQSKYGG